MPPPADHSFAILEALPDIVFVKDLDGVFLAVNQACAEFIGHPREEILGRTDFDFFDHHIASFFREQDAIMLSLGQPRKNDEWVTYPDGRKVLLEMLKKPFYGSDGRLVGILGIGRDVTDRYQAEQSLRESEARQRAITESTQDAIIMADAQGCVEFWNPAATHIFGYTAEEARGRKVHELLAPPPLQKAAQAGMSTFLRTGHGPLINKTVEVMAVHKKGHQLPLQLSLSAFRNEDGWHSVAIARDVTQLKENEKALIAAKEAAEAASQAKSQFLSVMSHEMRTPLNVVLGLARILQESPLNPQQRKLLTLLQSNGQALLELIGDVLDFAKLEAGKLELHPKPFALTEFLREFGEGASLLARQKQLSWQTVLDENLPAWVRGDALRLRQILQNLTNNALKFTHTGGIKLAVSLVGQKDGQPLVRFSVTDTGIGIPPEKHELVFERFQQADASTSRKFGGTGLGLSICRELVQAMGGEMGLRSAEGQGSEFWFTVPLPLAEPPSQNAPPSLSHHGTIGRTIHVLVVEDYEPNRMVIGELLGILGAGCTFAENGADALHVLSGQEFDAVLMDIQMPGMDGLETTRRIRQGAAGAEKSCIPIIGLTAYAEKEYREQAAQAGMNDCLAKPVYLPTLQEALAKLNSRQGALHFPLA